MKRTLIILALGLAISIGNAVAFHVPKAVGKESVSITDFIETSRAVDINLSRFDNLIAHLEKKQSNVRTQRDFVKLIFARTHTQILKRYETNAEFHELFEDGTYNCLTGTILYSLILDHFNIQHQVIETNYHIFITAQTEQGEILIEATDPIKGFVHTKEQIEERIESYKENLPVNNEISKDAYRFSFNLYNAVSQSELLGLLYYNLAVKAYNNQHFQQATALLEKASERYNSVRINEFAGILLYGISQSNQDDQSKLQEIKSLRTIRNKSVQTVAGI